MRSFMRAFSEYSCAAYFILMLFGTVCGTYGIDGYVFYPYSAAILLGIWGTAMLVYYPLLWLVRNFRWSAPVVVLLLTSSASAQYYGYCGAVPYHGHYQFWGGYHSPPIIYAPQYYVAPQEQYWQTYAGAMELYRREERAQELHEARMGRTWSPPPAIEPEIVENPFVNQIPPDQPWPNDTIVQ